MKSFFPLLTALIFLWRRLHEKPLTVPASQDSSNFLAPLNGVVVQASQDLIIAILVAGLITLAVVALLGRWR